MDKVIASKELRDLQKAEIGLERKGFLTDELRIIFNELKNREIRKIKVLASSK